MGWVYYGPERDDRIYLQTTILHLMIVTGTQDDLKYASHDRVFFSVIDHVDDIR